VSDIFITHPVFLQLITTIVTIILYYTLPFRKLPQSP